MANQRPKTKAPSATSKTSKSLVSAPVEKSNLKLKSKKPSSPKPTVFSIPKGGGIWYKLKQDDILHYDEEKGYNREIRFCPAEKSIFVDEQSNVARREQIVFRDKTLMVKHTSPNLSEYLRHHPDNIANGGSVFIEVNDESSAESELESEFMIHDAITFIKDADVDTLIPIALSYGIDSGLSSLEIKRALIQQAKGDPKVFMEATNSPLVQLRAIVVTAIDFQILKANADGMYWFDSNQIIAPTPVGTDTTQVFTRFLMSDRGYGVREELERQLNDL